MEEKLLIRGVKAYTMSPIGVLERASILVEGGVIRDVVKGDVEVSESNVKVLDCRELTGFSGCPQM